MYGRNKSPESNTFRAFKASNGTRTCDPFITSEVLYQLSYGGLLKISG